MMDDDEFMADEVAWINGVFASAAVRISSQQRFRGFVTYDDLFQVMWEWLLKNTRKYRRWEREHEGQEEAFERLLTATVVNEATHYARHERAARSGYKPGDEFFYDKQMLELLIGAAFDPEAALNPPKPEDDSGVRHENAPNEGNGWIATLADVRAAIGRLEQKDRLTLYDFYSGKHTPKDLERLWEVANSTVYARADSAVKKVWNELGGPRWLGTQDVVVTGRRKSMSNAQAQTITSNDWNPA